MAKKSKETHKYALSCIKVFILKVCGTEQKFALMTSTSINNFTTHYLSVKQYIKGIFVCIILKSYSPINCVIYISKLISNWNHYDMKENFTLS